MVIKVSVIIPMYNVEKVLRPCIHSLRAQTLKGVELIFVDDCSEDRTLELLEKELTGIDKEDFSVKIIRHQSNSGVAAARNTGLEHATGQFVYYVDADDSIESCTLELMYEEMLKVDADIVGCEWFLSFHESERLMRQAHATTGKELFLKMTNGVMRWNLWLFMVKRSLYEENGIRFIDGMNMGEDMMVMMKLALCAKRCSVVHIPFYHYIQTNCNSLTKGWSDEYRHQVTTNMIEVERYVNDHFEKGYEQQLHLLKLNLKLPLLISDKASDYERWVNWFPESNTYVGKNEEISQRMRWIQVAAAHRQFWIVRLYYWIVIKSVYGFIYK